MALHPRSQIAGDWVVTPPTPPTRTEIASESRGGATFLAHGHRFESQRASTHSNLRIASPTCHITSRNRRIRAAKRPQIAESPATRPLSLGFVLKIAIHGCVRFFTPDWPVQLSHSPGGPRPQRFVNPRDWAVPGWPQ